MAWMLERYVARKILLATLAVMMAAAALVYVVSFLGELRQVGEGDYGLLQAALYALLELPFNVSQFFPMLVLLGGLSGLGILAAHQELVVMRVSGLSPGGFMRGVLFAGVLLSVLGLGVGEAAAPRLHYIANMRKTMDLSGGQAVVTQSGLWVHQQNSFIHIRQISAHHHLEGITRYAFDSDHRLLSAEYADSMDLQNGQWVVHQPVRTVFSGSTRAVSESAKNAVWDVQLNPVVLNAGLIEPEEIPLDRLRLYTRHLVRNGMQAVDFQFSYARRSLRPLAIVVMLFLALPFVFVPPRTLSPGLRLFLGVLSGFVFYILNTLLGQLSVIFQLSPWLSALFPIALFAALDVWLLRRIFR